YTRLPRATSSGSSGGRSCAGNRGSGGPRAGAGPGARAAPAIPKHTAVLTKTAATPPKFLRTIRGLVSTALKFTGQNGLARDNTARRRSSVCTTPDNGQ